MNVNKNIDTFDCKEIKKDIDILVSSLRDKICRCNPEELLLYTQHIFLRNMIVIDSDERYMNIGKNPALGRMTEYIQSVLVASQNLYDPIKDKGNNIEQLEEVRDDFLLLDKNLARFHLTLREYYIDTYKGFDKNILNTIIDAQLFYMVRGKRYPAFEIEYFNALLNPHETIIKDLFDIEVIDILNGIEKIQIALLKGKINAISKLKWDENSNNELDQCTLQDAYSTKLNNVIGLTDWPEEFVELFAFSLGEDEKFFKSNYAGWPNVDLPIQKKPFIKLNGEYLCFDYYSFVDNFYRMFQKTVSRLAPNYSWKDIQQIASERMVANLFKKILPNSLILENNYYPIEKSLKLMAENDLLIQYLDVLIIVEVKAGSFIYTAPMTDFEGQINSYKNLVEKSDHQCNRTLDYIKSTNTPIIYDEKNEEKHSFDTAKITEIYTISVTVDNINTFANRAEKLDFLNLKCNTVSLAVDDLMVYREYFDSPLMFLHYLKQRKKATYTEKLELHDELEHLGMYINHNDYYNMVKGIEGVDILFFSGYMEEIEKYLIGLFYSTHQNPKPMHNIPPLFLKLLNYIDAHDIENKHEIANLILDFSVEERYKICQDINNLIYEQPLRNSMASLSMAGNTDALKFTCFVNQIGVPQKTFDDKRRNVLSTLIWNDEKERLLMDLYFDKNNNFIKASFKKYNADSIEPSEYESLKHEAEIRSKILVLKYKEVVGKKIGRNQICPCGSGKKYKKCCLNKQ